MFSNLGFIVQIRDSRFMDKDQDRAIFFKPRTEQDKQNFESLDQLGPSQHIGWTQTV